MPAEAGIQILDLEFWIPAFAGMTAEGESWLTGFWQKLKLVHRVYLLILKMTPHPVIPAKAGVQL